MTMRCAVLLGALLFGFSSGRAAAQGAPHQWETLPPSIPPGEVMYQQYCAACHGPNAKGGGPAAASLKIPPPDLTTLAKRHDGKFPYDYISTILRFGPGSSSHGSPGMPIWGPIFGTMDRLNARAVGLRIKNLSDYLASLQEK